MKRKQANVLTPSKLLLRCFALKREGYWVAMCIDLDLAVQANTAAEARKLLGEQMRSYVNEALTVDLDHAAELLSRKAPLRYRATYHFIKLWNKVRHQKPLAYQAPLPMVLATGNHVAA